jgi:hypothetical protein
MDSPDIVQYQRIASGYIPGASELFANTAGAPSQPPASGSFQNCTVVRPAGAVNAAGVYDIIVGPPQAQPNNQTALRSPNGPAPVGLGGPFIASPPLLAAFAPGEVVVIQGRFRHGVRSGLQQPPAALGKPVFVSHAYGATFLAGAPPLYPGFSNAQIIRVFVENPAGAAVDADIDFDIDRVIDAALEP